MDLKVTPEFVPFYSDQHWRFAATCAAALGLPNTELKILKVPTNGADIMIKKGFLNRTERDFK